MKILALIFWALIVLVIYPYAIYPLLAVIAGALFRRKLDTGEITPSLSVIITAYNEAGTIEQKLENTLALNYPRDRMEIIVASDASDDGTDQIVGRFAGRGVRLVRAPERSGKTAAQNRAIEVASGEILVFTDATTMLYRNSLHSITRPFADPRVGCVSGQDLSVEGVRGSGVEAAGLYTRFEAFVRNSEARFTSLVGVSGSFYAVRRSLRPIMEPELIDDFYVPLHVAREGFLALPEPDAVGIVKRPRSFYHEYQRKVRTFLTGMITFYEMRGMLNPLRYGMISFQLASHKLARWLSPFFLYLLFLVNLPLVVKGPFYAVAFAAQVLFYLVALAGHLMLRARYMPPRPVRFVFFVVMVNVALIDAWQKFLSGERIVAWEPTKR